MKKLFYLVAAFGLFLGACEDFDDTDLQNKYKDLDQRLTELETTVAALNQDIAGVQTLVEAVQNGYYVSKIVEGETGYEIFFTNGQSIQISDGKDGEAGADGVTVTVMLDEDGKYYWAVTKDGATSFIEVDGEKLPVKGDAPLMRVTMQDETGYWEVSYDNGLTWERILLEDGTPVTTSGGAGGLFKAAYVDEKTNTAVFEFLNGETLEIGLRSDLYINFKSEIETLVVEFGKTATVEFEAVGVLKAVVTTPDEWNAKFDVETGVLTVSAPALAHAECADLGGEVSIIYFGNENQSSVVTLPVSVGFPVEAEMGGSTLEVPYTFTDQITVEQVDSWISATEAAGVVTLTVDAHSGVARTGTINLVAANYTVTVIVNQKGVAVQEHGYRVGSETVVWSKALSEISGLTADNASHIAATGDYLIISAPNETPVVLNATTGEYVGTLDLGVMAGANAAITADSEGNIVVSSFNESGSFRIGRMKSIDDTLEVFITRASADYGKDLSVVGNVYGTARLTMMYSPWSSGTTGHLLYNISGGVADAGYWSKIAAGDTGATINNNNGDVIYRDVEEGSPYFMVGYSANNVVWAENGTAQYVQTPTNSDGTVVTGGSDAVVAVDVTEFNNAKYLMTLNHPYWWTALTGIFMADVTTLDSFKAGLQFYPSSTFNVDFVGGNATSDCALCVSENGVYMYAYALFDKNTLICVRVDCLAEAPAEEEAPEAAVL